MIVKKLLFLTATHLNSLGVSGWAEVCNTHIPGLANPVDRRCQQRGTRAGANSKHYDRMLDRESKSIIAWVKAFDICRAHHNASLSSGGKGKAAGDNATKDKDDMSLDELRQNEATPDEPEFVKLQYYLPSILRPVVTAQELMNMDDFQEAQVSGVLPPAPADMDAMQVSHGFQEGVVTLVLRPVVTEDFYLDFERGYDIGALPPLVRIVLLDFIIGCSDPDVAECVLSVADRVPLTTLGRQQRFYSQQSNCMDTYVRQDVYGAWKAGFERHQTTMAAKYETENLRGREPMQKWEIVAMLMEKAVFYAQQAIQFHCSNITDGVYRSEILTHVFEMYKQLKAHLPGRVKGNLKTLGRSVKPKEWNALDSTSQMRLLFYRALRGFNEKAHMSYTNIAIVTELFTTMIQWFIHPGNATWSNWLIPLQVVPQKAQLYRTYHKEGNKSICVDKPNSTGVDEVACRAFDGMMALCNSEVTRSDGRALDLAMCKAGRETPVARERRNKVMVCRNMVVAEPDPSLVNRMQSSTEERNLGDADLDAKIRVTPRNRTTIRDGTVFTTDTNDKGTREAQRWEPVGGYHVGLQATNCQINSVRNQEQWETQLVATKCMSTGRDIDRKRKRVDRGDFTVNHASGSSQSVRDPVRSKELSTLLCVLPHITGSFVGLMNKLGFTSMEVAPMTQNYMDYLYWRFDTLFSRFVGVRLGKSFQRTTQGHYGRHIADYAMARLTLEVAKSNDFDDALATTINVLSYNCLPISAVPTWMDDAMREGVDGQLLVLHNVVSHMLYVPHLDLEWLCKALTWETLSGVEQALVLAHKDAEKLAVWVDNIINHDCFMYEEDITVQGNGSDGGGGSVMRGEKRVFPYITTPLRATEEQSYLRTKTKNRGLSEEVAKKIAKHPEMVTYSKNTGFTTDEKVIKCMIDRCEHLSLGLENAFGVEDLCNPERIFDLVRRKRNRPFASPISPVVQQNISAMTDPAYAMMKSVTVNDTTEVMFGVNMTLLLVLTSMVEGNSTPNSQIDERLTRSIMWLMMRDVPVQFTGQTGDAYLRKNFRGNHPLCDSHALGALKHTRPSYFVRPTHDHEKNSSHMTHFGCDVYKNYAPEDCAHMSELAALTKRYNTTCVLDISLQYVVPRYMFMYDVVYPIAFTQQGHSYEQQRLGKSIPRVKGYLKIQAPSEKSTPSVKAHTTPWKIVIYGEDHWEKHSCEGENVWNIEEALCQRHTVVLPLIQRHNAVAFIPKLDSFVVIQPIKTPVGRDPSSYCDDTFFIKDEPVWGYRVLEENKPQGSVQSVDAFYVEDSLLPLASTIWIRWDAYLLCVKANKTGSHVESPYGVDVSNPANVYVSSALSYPHSYPKKAEQYESIFVEVAHGDSAADQLTYVKLEINLPALHNANMYSQDTRDGLNAPTPYNPPLTMADPRLKDPNMTIVDFRCPHRV